ncbi:hypothetical protein ABZT03_06330 [Streptomyces sp. NPDC005574]|uniref:hypothetical protein n=1 Tax=Streptomyces sp. NPDC005574 TaxID=3156891 RepID=UPI0033A1F9E4
MSGGADFERNDDISGWPVERLRSLTADAADWRLEVVRVIAQAHAYRAGQPLDERRQWAELSLLANQRMRVDGPAEQARVKAQEFALRTWVIDRLGRDDENPYWHPESLASDTLDALTLTPSQATALAGHWRDLPIEQIRALRRHKNLTAHLETLLAHLRSGPVQDQLLIWTRTRRLLP